MGCCFCVYGTEAIKFTISAFYVAYGFYNVLKRKDLWRKAEVFFGSNLYAVGATPGHITQLSDR
ncbi:hypothetical protein [Nostoc sp. DedQUE09]|uniref:hypothetical protein n=1 Tax=Nostoc sp. DedQUE09 TaxID=3075394 RepID=UPI002AD5AE66|nr:hypothetical protein [Nostoc sp. DedQUE09]MDZ7949709.1 hypothetical protein [Nostoc sp. DedQUE09]